MSDVTYSSPFSSRQTFVEDYHYEFDSDLNEDKDEDEFCENEDGRSAPSSTTILEQDLILSDGEMSPDATSNTVRHVFFTQNA